MVSPGLNFERNFQVSPNFALPDSLLDSGPTCMTHPKLRIIAKPASPCPRIPQLQSLFFEISKKKERVTAPVAVF